MWYEKLGRAERHCHSLPKTHELLTAPKKAAATVPVAFAATAALRLFEDDRHQAIKAIIMNKLPLQLEYHCIQKWC